MSDSVKKHDDFVRWNTNTLILYSTQMPSRPVYIESEQDIIIETNTEITKLEYTPLDIYPFRGFLSDSKITVGAELSNNRKKINIKYTPTFIGHSGMMVADKCIKLLHSFSIYIETKGDTVCNGVSKRIDMFVSVIGGSTTFYAGYTLTTESNLNSEGNPVANTLTYTVGQNVSYKIPFGAIDLPTANNMKFIDEKEETSIYEDTIIAYGDLYTTKDIATGIHFKLIQAAYEYNNPFSRYLELYGYTLQTGSFTFKIDNRLYVCNIENEGINNNDLVCVYSNKYVNSTIDNTDLIVFFKDYPQKALSFKYDNNRWYNESTKSYIYKKENSSNWVIQIDGSFIEKQDSTDRDIPPVLWEDVLAIKTPYQKEYNGVFFCKVSLNTYEECFVSTDSVYPLYCLNVNKKLSYLKYIDGYWYLDDILVNTNDVHDVCNLEAVPFNSAPNGSLLNNTVMGYYNSDYVDKNGIYIGDVSDYLYSFGNLHENCDSILKMHIPETKIKVTIVHYDFKSVISLSGDAKDKEKQEDIVSTEIILKYHEQFFDYKCERKYGTKNLSTTYSDNSILFDKEQSSIYTKSTSSYDYEQARNYEYGTRDVYTQTRRGAFEKSTSFSETSDSVFNKAFTFITYKPFSTCNIYKFLQSLYSIPYINSIKFDWATLYNNNIIDREVPFDITRTEYRLYNKNGDLLREEINDPDPMHPSYPPYTTIANTYYTTNMYNIYTEKEYDISPITVPGLITSATYNYRMSVFRAHNTYYIIDRYSYSGNSSICSYKIESIKGLDYNYIKDWIHKNVIDPIIIQHPDDHYIDIGVDLSYVEFLK